MPTERNTAEIDGQPLHYLRAGSGRSAAPVARIAWRRVLLAAKCGRFLPQAHDFCRGPAWPWRMRRASTSGLLNGRAGAARSLPVGAAKAGKRGCSWVILGWRDCNVVAAQSRRVRSLVLAAPVNPWSDFGAGRIRFLQGRLGAALLRMAWPVSRPLHRIAVERMYGDPRRVPAGTIEGYSSLAMRPGKVHSILNTLRSWEDDVNALSKAIPRITVPSLLIWGTRDGAVDLRSAEHLRRALPASELKLIEGAGHLPFEETPDEFNRLVLDFVERTRAESGSA